MTCVSGIACVVGSSIICVDLIVQRIPSKKDFRIQDSDAFLSASLSLSFGVMLFSSLYSMLPSAKDYLIHGGLSPRSAAYAVIGCFLGGVIGIQLVSRLLHHYIPSHVVDCDHTHDKQKVGLDDGGPHENHMHENGQAHRSDSASSEDTPLLSREDFAIHPRLSQRSMSDYQAVDGKQGATYLAAPSSQRPNFQTRLTGLMSGRKTLCDQNGPCHGYSDPCTQECFKAINRNPPPHVKRSGHSDPRRQTNLFRTPTDPHPQIFSTPELSEETTHPSSKSQPTYENSSQTIFQGSSAYHQPNGHSHHSSSKRHTYDPESNRERGKVQQSGEGHSANDPAHNHHHHVPTNAFLSIGLQTSIAIALHKLPEGFITYATNHANPTLGFSVFMALFIHNITEGFAMALPLYLAINSRWRAMFWSSLLGGVSQPLGAGIAALWLKAAGRGDNAPGETVYGCMFAITAGIMASVALQLFSESLSLSHERNLCIAFAFLGMAILGISFALTAG
ncbi:MAG: hypothetical protein Q9195_001269 [Heterodermia aff. obscurata]